MVHCIEAGLPLLIENLPEEVDAVLDGVIGKQLIKRGRAQLLRLGDAEVEYNPNFRCVRGICWFLLDKNARVLWVWICQCNASS